MNSILFAKILIDWWHKNKRDLPWKHTKDPYKIWVSEIILQQTRVDQGTPYYHRFIKRFPDVFVLAKASEDDVLKVWEGLGYYTRARNLHSTAKQIVKDNDGLFPENYEDIIKLKGIGPYSAAAISSFAFEGSHAVVDGNVTRMVTRILGIYDAVELPETKKSIQSYVSSAIQTVRPSSFNQALLDFGSQTCTPKDPGCAYCPFNLYCKAYHQNVVKILPIKRKKQPRKIRYFHYLDLSSVNQIILHQRSKNDIWKNLFELPMIETDSPTIENPESLLKHIDIILNDNNTTLVSCHKIYESTQLLTHQKINGYFYSISIAKISKKINPSHYLVERKKVSNFAFPKIITEYFRHLKKTDELLF
ncbi:MAG: A/G-specific adenine glycosylase [Saprospiraceae bacterium]|nr:A/G-specific adenine glycosylase [Saprospiraceae bacterium]